MTTASIVVVPPGQQDPNLPQVDLPQLPVQPPLAIEVAPEQKQEPQAPAPERVLPETVVEAPAPPRPPLSERVSLFRDLPSPLEEGPPLRWDGDHPLVPVSPTQDSASILRGMADQVRALADDAATKVEPPRNNDQIMAIMEMIRRDAMRRGATEEEARALAEAWRERVQRFSPGRMAINAVIGAGNNLASMAADAVSAALGRSEPIRAPSIPTAPGAETAEQVATKFGEALVAFALGRGAGMGNIAAGALADASFDPAEGGLVSLLRSLGIAEDTLAAFDSRVAEDATTWERLRGRLMQVGEGMIVAAAVAGLIPLLARAFGQRGQAATQPAGSPPPAAQQAVDDMQPPVAAADQAPPAPPAQAAAQADGAPTPVVQADTTGQSGQFIPPGVNATDGLPPPPANAQLNLPTTKGATGSITANGQTVAEVRLDEVIGKDPGEGIIVFHGSPYVFDKFDFSKIGTGEGNQAYGYGLYFAETTSVARSYRPPPATYVVIDGQTMGRGEFALKHDINMTIDRHALYDLATDKEAADIVLSIHDDVIRRIGNIETHLLRRDFDNYVKEFIAIRDLVYGIANRGTLLQNYRDAVMFILRQASPSQPNQLDSVGDILEHWRPGQMSELDKARDAFLQMDSDQAWSLASSALTERRYLNQLPIVIKNYAGRIRLEQSAGALYKVRLNVDVDKLIHYDKFEDQPGGVLRALNEMAMDAARAFEKMLRGVEPSYKENSLALYFTRRGYYHILSDKSMPLEQRTAAAVNELVATSQGHIVPINAREAAAMRSYGIQGIKYLDGNSRRRGEGTYNYAVFDDKFAKILERYAVIPVAGVAASEAVNAAQAED